LLWFTLAAFCLLPSIASADGIAVISHVDIAPYRAAIDGFRQQVNLSITRYVLDNDSNDTVREAIAAQQPELIFVLGKPALKFARTLQRPPAIVLAFVLHPEPLSANEYGVAMTTSPSLQLKTLLTIIPNIQTIGAIYNPEKSSALIKKIKQATDSNHIQLLNIPVATHAEAAQSAKQMASQVDAIWIIPDTTTLTATLFHQEVRFSWQYGIPLIGLAAKHVRKGCLFALSFNNRSVGEQAGRLAERIIQKHLHGKQMPSILEPLETNKLFINTRAADILGIKIPPRIMQQADQIYPIRQGGVIQ